MRWGTSAALRFVVVVLIASVLPSRSASAQVDPKLIEAGRRATVYVVIEADKGLYMGSGFCIDATGIFITNQHVVEPLTKEKNAKIYLIVAAGTKAQRIYTPTVVKSDAARDVAVLRVERPGPLDALELASPAAIASMRETAPVVAFGFPLGQRLSLKKESLPEITITTGRVSAMRHEKGQLVTIQFDASVTHGNSGGPLIDAHGQVVGVVTAGVEGKQINFAGPVGFIRTVLSAANVVLTPRVLTNAAAANDLIDWLASDGPATRKPVPGDAAFKENQKLLKDVLSKQYADTTPAGRYSLVLELLSRASASKDDPAGRYTMLVEARENAIVAGDVTTAAYTALMLSEDYAVMPIDVMKDVVLRVSGRSGQPQDSAWVSALGMMICEAMARREQYTDMRKLVPLVRSNGIASRNVTVSAQIRDRLPRLETMAAEFDRVQSARAKLAAAPADPEANLIVGRYLALTRGDLDKGVPLLAKGSDAGLKALAVADQAGPATAEAQKAVGDLWWDQATKEAKNPAIADLCKSRAGFWYLQALPQLTGLVKSLVEKRLTELPSAPPEVAANTGGSDSPVAVATPSGSPRVGPQAAGLSPEKFMARVQSYRNKVWTDAGSARKPLAAEPPILGEVTWPGGAHALSGRLSIGQEENKKENRPTVKGTLQIAPGCLVEGGTIIASQGVLDISGEPGRPVVFRKVRFGVELSGRLKARHAVFDQCSFAKSGGWFVDSYSAKFEFTNCLFVESKFDRLSRVDYGFKLNGCAFVNCALSERSSDTKHDSYKISTSEWSMIRDCDFYGCQIAASVAWCMNTSNLFGCQITGKECVYSSGTGLIVTLGLPKAESKQILADLAAKTSSSDTGRVSFEAADGLYVRTTFGVP